MRRRLAPTRTAAQRAVDEGRVRVDGVPRPKPATLVAADAAIDLRDPDDRYAGRGGHKLAGALDAFGVIVAGRRAVDAGASTGGFTDCLLQRGAASVAAVDVGYGQLAWQLRSDPRVTVFDRTNVRHADPGELGAPFGVVVADLSFISLVTVAPALAALGGVDADHVLLVKPQFEVGRDRVGKGGVVRDPALHAAALRRVAAGLERAELGVVAATPSQIRGAAGNREFFVHARQGPRTAGDEQLGEVVAADVPIPEAGP